MFIRSLPFAIPRSFRTFRLNAKSVELVLLDSALLGIAVALKLRIGPR